MQTAPSEHVAHNLASDPTAAAAKARVLFTQRFTSAVHKHSKTHSVIPAHTPPTTGKDNRNSHRLLLLQSIVHVR